jgi:hypothetical protein
MVEFIDQMMKTSLCLMQDLSHLCTIKLTQILKEFLHVLVTESASSLALIVVCLHQCLPLFHIPSHACNRSHETVTCSQLKNILKFSFHTVHDFEPKLHGHYDLCLFIIKK